MDPNFPLLGLPDVADLSLLQTAAQAWAQEPDSPLWMRRRFRLWKAALQGSAAMRAYLLGPDCPFAIALDDPLTAVELPPEGFTAQTLARMPTPLGWAAFHGLTEAFEDLVARGARVDAGTPLWPALIQGLIRRGAKGHSPLDLTWADRLDRVGAPWHMDDLARQLLVAFPDQPQATAWFDAVVARTPPQDHQPEALVRSLRQTLKRIRYRPGGSPGAVHQAAEVWWPRLLQAGVQAPHVDPHAEALIAVCGALSGPVLALVTDQPSEPVPAWTPPLQAPRARRRR